MYGGVLRFNSRLKGKLLAMRILIGMYNFKKVTRFLKLLGKVRVTLRFQIAYS